MNSFFSSVSSKVIAWFTFVATIIAIVGGMTMFDDRYARADDVQKTQEMFVKSIKLVNINLELINLKSRRLELRGEKRSIMIQITLNPKDIELKIILTEIREDLETINNRIAVLENTVITK